MSHANPERDERDGEYLPERIFVRSFDPNRPLKALYKTHEVAAERVNEDSVEYIRADIPATRMRDRCVEKVKLKADGYQKDSERSDFLPNYRKQMALAASALREVANDLQSLTLEGEQNR